MDLVKRQPVLTVGVVVSAIVAVIAALNSFGVTHLTQAQTDALTSAVIAMWPVLLIIWSQVTPAASPKLPEGKDVKLPDGTAGTVVRK